jgi:hypothetical protein
VRVPAWTDPATFPDNDVLRNPPGSLDLEQRAHLALLAERIRAAHDLLLALGARYAALPTQFADAQAREMALLSALHRRYAPGEPVHASPAAGQYADPTVQTEYDRLLERGRTGRAEAAPSIAEALRGVLELLDADLPRVSAADVHEAYSRLCAATVRQLQAVQAWSSR